tara:strand:- start:178 stop:1311 length:1134 start_codon:yes stop_codon:yes gene_type:complete
MELLDLSKCETNKEVSDIIKKRVKDANLAELTKTLSKRFVFHEESIRTVYTALAVGGNAVLHGPGGFGKSDIVKAICHELGIPVICKLGYKDMTPEELLGVPNMTMLLEESKYETAFENSVFSTPGILLLEEFFDAAPSTAAALKDVLTEKGFREGATKKESLISSVIITGNQDPEELAVDATTKAFYKDRFQYRKLVVWKTFTEANYQAFFDVYWPGLKGNCKKEFALVAKLCEGNNTMVSPRVAAQAADTALTLGVEFLDTIADLNTDLLEEMLEEVEEDARRKTETELLDAVFNAVKEVRSNLSQSLGDLQNDKYKLMYIKETLFERQFSDSVSSKLGASSISIREGLQEIEDAMMRTVDQEHIHNSVNTIFYD